MIKLAVDMMGSDSGPKELALGLKKFLKDTPRVKVVVFGDPKVLGALLANDKRIEICPATQIVPMEVDPLGFLRLKDSSLYLAIQAASDSKKAIDGVITAGSTGGFVTGCTLLLKNAPGVIRAGLAAPFITAIPNKKTVILDIGASNKNTPEELVGFAKMGVLYAKAVLGIQSPKIYLLSNGTEEGKGLPESVEAYKRLKAMNFPGFGGNVESRDVLDGERDVVVTTGYPGNIMLKSFEGTAQLMNSLLKKAFKKNIFTKLGYLLAKPGLKQMKRTINYKETGGAMLLGVSKVAVKAHGNSDAYAFYNALQVAYAMAAAGIVKHIAGAFAHEG